MAKVLTKKAHPVVRTVIKEADVDKEMVPLVNWMNAFRSVHTLYCCQGDDPKKGKKGERVTDICDKPYVLWTCTDTIDLIVILGRFGWYGETQIIWNEDKRHIEYCTRFNSKAMLKDIYLGGIKC